MTLRIRQAILMAVLGFAAVIVEKFLCRSWEGFNRGPWTGGSTL